MGKKLLCVFFWLVIVLPSVIGQSGDRLQFTFKNFNATSGLLGNQVSAIVQDAKGYFWIGGTDGLQRYDGVRFKSFRHLNEDSTSLPSNPIAQLLFDAKGHLWVLLADGTPGIFDTERFTFRTARVTPHKKANYDMDTRKLTADEFGNVFLVLWPREVLTWNEKANEFSVTNNFFKTPDDWRIEDFIQQPGTQKYWIALFSGGFAVYDRKTDSLSYTGNNAGHEKIIDTYKTAIKPYKLFFDNKDRLWFMHWGPGTPFLYCYDLAHQRPYLERRELISQTGFYIETSSFFEQKTGEIWICGTKVLGRFNEETKRFELVANGHTSNRGIDYDNISSLYEDQEGNIWVPTTNNGIYVCNPGMEYFTNIPHIFRNEKKPKGTGSVTSMIHARDGTILAATWGDGLYRYDSHLHAIPLRITGIPDNNFYSIWDMWASADSNTIWMSAQPGIFRYDQDARKATFYHPPALRDQTLRQIAEDRFGNLWIGLHFGGLRKWVKAKGQREFNDGIEPFDSITPNQHILQISVDSRGLVWVATSAAGAYAIDPATNKVVLHFSNMANGALHLPEKGVYGVLEYNDSLMLVATLSKLIVYNRNTGRSGPVSSIDAISGYIRSMEKDNSGFVWISTTTGIYRLTMRNQMLILFDRRDGIANEQFEIAASCKLPDGRLLFGASDQFISFQPKNIEINDQNPPPVQITDIRIKNKAVRVDSLQRQEQIRLPHEQNSLVIDFSTLRIVNPYVIRYKMEGLDKDWRISDRSYSVVYSYLPPGDFSLLLRAEDIDGHTGPVTKLAFTIEPPFWETWWFYSLLVLLGGALLFWYDRERLARKEALFRMRTDIADELHKEVNLALNNINILSEMARLKAEKDTSKAIEYIEQINLKSQAMIGAMDHMLWTISPANDSMEKNIAHLREHIDTLRNRYNVHIDLLVDKKVNDLKLDMKQRQHIVRMFKSGITNFVRTGARDCRVHIAVEKNNLVYTIEFDNTHSDLQQQNNMVKRQELERWLAEINAQLDVQNHRSHTIVILTIPLR